MELVAKPAEPAPPPSDAPPRRTTIRKKVYERKPHIADVGSEVFCVRYSPDGQYLAVGTGDGSVRVYVAQTGRLLHVMNDGQSPFPISSIRWRPPEESRVKNVLVAGNADGVVQHWHATQGKSLFRFVEPDNQVLAMDYRPDGARFATVGKDRKVRIYDDATKTHVQTLFGGHGTVTTGHSNRVFALKYHPMDPNCIITGGWDMTLQVWDTRVDHSVRSIYGPHICGDALDIHGDQILTGSWRTRDALQLWDLGSGRLIENIAWNREGIVSSEPTLLYAAQFSKDPQAEFILAGGSGANQAKLFERTTFQVIEIIPLPRSLFCCDFAPDGSSFAVGGAEPTVRIHDIRTTAK